MYYRYAESSSPLSVNLYFNLLNGHWMGYHHLPRCNHSANVGLICSNKS